MYYLLKNRVDEVQSDQKELREIPDNLVTQASTVNRATTANLVQLVNVVYPGHLVPLVRACPFTCFPPTKSMMLNPPLTTLLTIVPTGLE